MSLPNSISVARIGLVPAFVFLGYGDSDASRIGAFVVFFVASVSDYVDGYLARRWNHDSGVGQWLDPLADKLLIGAALVLLVDELSFPAWAAAIIAAREVSIQILRIRVVRGGGRLPASPGAKIKTVVQLGMVSWWVLPWESIGFVHWLWVAAALAATVWTGVEYFVKTTAREPAAL